MTQISPTNEEDMLYPCKEVSFHDKKEWNLNTYYNIDKPSKYYTERKKPITKGHIRYDSTYMKGSRGQKNY